MNIRKLICVFLMLVAGYFLLYRFFLFPPRNSSEIVYNTWNGFKHYFIDSDGRVNRIKSNDVVSEGQAYAMLRAVWVDDQETFDRVFDWTQENLARKEDHLLAWRWQNGNVIDSMPAADADIDYALALIFAHSKWEDSNRSYQKQAQEILNDILDKMTVRIGSRLYLMPWIVDNKNMDQYPQNPSYYSPAHFRIFYEATKDQRWLELADTSYYVLQSLLDHFNNQKGIGLIPDWCAVNKKEEFSALEGKSQMFGWEAVRIPFRVALDWLWFGQRPAQDVLKQMSGFFNSQLKQNHKIYSEYNYTGETNNPYENPAFYAAYDLIFTYGASENDTQKTVIKKNRKNIHIKVQGWIYMSKDEYFVNSLAWWADGLRSGIIRNLYK